MVLSAQRLGKPAGRLRDVANRVHCLPHVGPISRCIHCMNQRLIVTAVAPNHSNLVLKLTRLIRDCSAEVSEFRMTELGSDVALHTMITGNWHALSRVEKELEACTVDEGSNLFVRRSDIKEGKTDLMPYNVDAVTLRQTEVITSFIEFFSIQDIDIVELSTSSFTAQHTGTAMASVQMTVNVPGELKISVLREEFMDFCDSVNVDANLEPCIS